MMSYERKIHSADELKAALERERRAGTRGSHSPTDASICFTPGISRFSRSRARRPTCWWSDSTAIAACAQLKGDGRPIYPAAERARILAALEAVDYVVVFDETRAEKIIRAVKPDVLIKGEDWRGKAVDGQEFVESRGGRVALAPLLGGRSHQRDYRSDEFDEFAGAGKTARDLIGELLEFRHRKHPRAPRK